MVCEHPEKSRRESEPDIPGPTFERKVRTVNRNAEAADNDRRGRGKIPNEIR